MTFTDQLEAELEGAIAQHGQRTRRRRLATAAVAVVALGAGVAWWQTGGGEDETTDVATATSTPVAAPSATAAPEPTVPEPAPPGLAAPEVLDDSVDPGSDLDLVGTVMVWMGDELFVWGGTRDFGAGTTTSSRGGVYDPVTQDWTPLPDAPGGPQAEAVGVWTGSEVLLCCGTNSGNALAFDPAQQEWRQLPDPPIAGGQPGPAGLWVNDRFVVLTSSEMVAYSPAADSWETLAPPPVPLTVSPPASVVAVGERQLVVWPRPTARTTLPGHVYDFDTDRWTQLPDPPAASWPAVADVAWTGDELIVVGGLAGATVEASERMVGSRLDWATMTWRSLPDVWPEPIPSEGNLGSQSIQWTGEVLVVLAGALGTGLDPLDTVVATYDPAVDRWGLLPRLQGSAWSPPMALVGDGLVMTNIAGALHTIDAAAGAGDPGPWSPAATPEFFDLPIRDVPLTLVASNGNGADILVLDLDFGLRTTYLDDEHHTIGPGGLTDLAMGPDRAFYVWRTDQPILRYEAGASPWDDRGSRLSFGELSQPGRQVGAAGRDRAVLPNVDGETLWQWQARTDRDTAALLDIATGGMRIAVDFDNVWRPVDVTAAGALVVTDGTASTAITAAGRLVDLGFGRAVVVAGAEALLQSCDDDGCTRRWVHGETGASRDAGGDAAVWASVGGPMIPGSSAPLPSTPPGAEQVLVSVGPLDGLEPPELRRVDVASGEYAVVDVADEAWPGVATWSRDGRYVVTASGRHVGITDLRSGEIESFRIPDGFFVLAAG